ncbi:MAG TPA: hypothetical protein H9881_04280 [Candidatus Stackebrandtia excrementipullorum]|nr:hypothetical protein [Candidatus Stackebrandtia excrementipullorum]
MATYTVRVERWKDEERVWRIETPDTQISSDLDADDVAAETALLQTVADGNRWRVQVWDGEFAAGEPAAEQDARRDP